MNRIITIGRGGRELGRRLSEIMEIAYYDQEVITVVVSNKRTTLKTYYKCKNDYEDKLAIQNEIFKIYDFDFCEQ